jgi:hypothetical protein
MTEREGALLLTALVYESGKGDEVNGLVAIAVERLRAGGLRIAGMVQRQVERPDRPRCDLIGHDLGSGIERPLSEDRGPAARGCRLDTSALEGFVALSEAALERGADVLVASRYGKREAQGAGFRDVIAAAASRGVQVLVPVHCDYLEAWQEFAGGLGCHMPATTAAVEVWCARVIEERRGPATDRSEHVAGVAG